MSGEGDEDARDRDDGASVGNRDCIGNVARRECAGDAAHLGIRDDHIRDVGRGFAKGEARTHGEGLDVHESVRARLRWSRTRRALFGLSLIHI